MADTADGWLSLPLVLTVATTIGTLMIVRSLFSSKTSKALVDDLRAAEKQVEELRAQLQQEKAQQEKKPEAPTRVWKLAMPCPYRPFCRITD